MGGNDAGKPALSTALYTVVGVAALALVLLLWSIVAAPAELVRDAARTIGKLRAQVAEAEARAQRASHPPPAQFGAKGAGLRTALANAEKRKHLELLGQAAIEGRQLYGRKLADRADFVPWNMDVQNWRTTTAKLIEQTLSPVEASDFLNTIGILAADVQGSLNRAHSDQLLALERQLKNLDTLRAGVAA